MDDRAVVGDSGNERIWRADDLNPVLGRPERTTTPIGGGGAAGEVVRVRVLGTPEILDVPADLHVRPQAVEFLTYLVVRGGTVYQDHIVVT